MVLKEFQRGFSTIGIALVIGAIVVAIGVSVLLSTDSQLRLSLLGQFKRDSDWTVRSAARITEQAWRRYLGVTQTGPFNFQGTVFNDVNLFSREDSLIWVQQQATQTQNPNFSLLPLFIERMNRDINTDGTDQIPGSYVYEVSLTDNVDGTNDGIVTENNVWNAIDNRHSFRAVITVTPNGLIRNSPDGSFRIFPIRFVIQLTVRSPGRGNQMTRTILGRGSCDLYLARRSFAQFIMYCDMFTMRDGGTIWFPNGFIYDGPVHTNGEFAFKDNPSTRFTDVVTSVSKTARYYWDEHLNADRSATVVPIFEKKFYRGVAPIPPPKDLVDIKKEVLAENTEPSQAGVYLVTTAGLDNGSGNGELAKGGIYIKGDVYSLKLQEGDRTQTYVIEHTVLKEPPDQSSTTFYDSRGRTTTEARAVKKVVETTYSANLVRYTITCNYRYNTTTLTKVTSTNTCNQKKKTIYLRSSTTESWPEIPVETYVQYTSVPNPWTWGTPVTYSYQGVVDAVTDVTQDPPDPTQRRKQPAIYIDGALGGLSDHSANVAPTGLNGKLDKETELTVCAKYPVVISEDTTYEEDPRQHENARNILGILSEYDNVYIDYINPTNNNVDIHASIMTPNGQFQAYDYQLYLGQPTINLLGGVVQKWYGPVATGTNGYRRNFVYDRRFVTQAPPFYPRQTGMTMQTSNQSNQETLQIVWDYGAH
ncbi:MAG: DUF4900 domain-containing protein [Firmicutes bacterium]|nr:DUF4900 domain-containing protein [Bacillota bacterium]